MHKPATLIQAQNLSNDAPKDALRIKLLPDSLEAGEMLHIWMVSKTEIGDFYLLGLVRALTLGSRFLTARAKTSRVFLVQ